MVYMLMYAYVASNSMGDFLDYIYLDVDIPKYHHKSAETEGLEFAKEKYF